MTARPRAGARLRLGERRRDARSPTCATPRAGCAATPGFTARRRAHAGARHRRHHGDLQRRQPDPVRAAALSRRRPDRDDLGRRHATGRALDVTFGTYRELARAEPLVRRAGRRCKPWQPTLDRARRARAARRAAGERRLLPDARRAAGARARLRRGRRSARTVPTSSILSDALWRRRFGGDPRSSAARSRSTTTPTPSSA